MQITLNGEPHEIDTGATVAALIEARGLADKACAAEVNGALVPKAQHGETVIGEGDRVELVTLVGGG
ncbi:MAG: sulfur carrier protein ThiS [Planctomycetota bacterium]